MKRILSLALLILALSVGLAQAQTPPHMFWGRGGTGSTALVDGQTVVGWSEANAMVGRSRIRDGGWTIGVDPDEARSVRFSVGGSARTPGYSVLTGGFTQIHINMRTPGASSAVAVVDWEPYVVRWGDTLSGIARRWEITLDALLRGNATIPNPNRITAGDTVLVPRTTFDLPAPPLTELLRLSSDERPTAGLTTPPPIQARLAFEELWIPIPAGSPTADDGSNGSWGLIVGAPVGAVATLLALFTFGRRRRRPRTPPAAQELAPRPSGEAELQAKDKPMAADTRAHQGASSGHDPAAPATVHRLVSERLRLPWLEMLSEEASASANAAPAGETDDDDMSCRAQTRRNRRCANPAGPEEGLCFLHKRMADRGLAVIDGSEELPGADRIAQ